jgi:hypothetical protein
MQRREASGGALGNVLGCDERKRNLEPRATLRLVFHLDPASVRALASCVDRERGTAGRRGPRRRAAAARRPAPGGGR